MTASHHSLKVHSHHVALDCHGESEIKTFPFIQPFLELSGDSGPLFIDINGDSSPFFTEEGRALLNDRKGGSIESGSLAIAATSLLKRLAQVLRAHGIHVRKVGLYTGSAGPTHVYRQGVLFKRMSELERPPASLAVTDWMDETPQQ